MGQAETTVVRVDRPFTGGLRDEPTETDQARVLRNGLYPLGVLCERDGHEEYGFTLGGDAFDIDAVYEEIITASNRITADLLVAARGTIGIATDVTFSEQIEMAGFIQPGSGADRPRYHFMPGIAAGEVVILPQDGESPILLYSGATGSPFASTFACDITAGSPTLTATAGTPFTSADVGRYVFVFDNFECRRIVKVVSSTVVTVDEPFVLGDTGSSTAHVYNFGMMNLRVEVTSLGKAAKNGTGATVTGTGTSWNTAASALNGRVAYYQGVLVAGVDTIEPVGVDYGSRCTVISVASDTSLDVYANSPPTWGASAVDYIVSRPMVAKVAAVHKTRLYTAGMKWAKRRVSMTRPLLPIRSPKNEEFSFEVDIARASIAANIDIPGPDAAGEITGLLSLPSGNLAVLSDIDTYIAWGEYPAISSEKTSSFGNFDGRSCIVIDDLAFFAGPDGVFEFVGNNPRSISAGHIDRTWFSLMDEIRGVDAPTPPTVVLGFHDRHLIVSVAWSAGERHFVWDTRSRTWPGEWDLPPVSYFYPSRSAGQRDRLLMANNATEPLPFDLGPAFVDHTQDRVNFATQEPLVATTPDDVAGDLSREREVKYVKVQYQLEALTEDPTLEVSPGPAPHDDVLSTLPVSAAPEVRSEIRFPYTDPAGLVDANLGLRTNRFDITLERTGDAADEIAKVAIHELEMLVKEYRLRG